MNILIVFSSFSPYHHARASAFSDACKARGYRLIPVAITAPQLRHQWTPQSELDIQILCRKGGDGDVSPLEISTAWLRLLNSYRPAAVVIAGYWPLSIALLGLIAMAKGIPRILMTESHSATARSTGLAAWVKRLLVSSYSAALVGGIPHQEHLQRQGFDPARIRDGYDCVDNQLFGDQADAVRRSADAYRKRYRLPDRYFLSVGRLVPKKNLRTLIAAYSEYLTRHVDGAFDLVVAGDGELRSELRSQCNELGLQVRDYSEERFDRPSAAGAPESGASATGGPAVSFYGSRTIEELPAFFALAQAFVLPSLEEEWGLVVNEAMGSGCPVLVSERAGCARDLLPEFAMADRARCGTVSPQVKLRRSGIVFDPERAEELAGALHVMATSPELRSAMALNAREIVGLYSPERFGEHLMQLVQLVKRLGTPDPTLTEGARPS